MNKKSVGALDVGRAKIKRAEYDDGLIRDNVRIDNKHMRELRVHERAKDVISRTFDKETQLFKQKQASQKARPTGLNSQGHKLRLSSTGSNHFSLGSPNATSNHWSSGSSPNGTLSPAISDSRSTGSKSPVTPWGDNRQFQYSPDLVIPPIQTNGQRSPDMPSGTEPPSLTKMKLGKTQDSSRLSIPHRQLSRNSISDETDSVSKNRIKSASRATYMDPFTGRVREETVFDFLSKPRNNYEVQKRKDIRVQLEKEFSHKKAEASKKVAARSSLKKKTIPISPFQKRDGRI
ncbi:hypothetical protein SNE40_021894 [Patella caerulea]|uniref:Uncharacterized protein n=1 Tax=Patella caerulea TaxID=87958 RepID=A0AAN8G8T8_PATCE